MRCLIPIVLMVSGCAAQPQPAAGGMPVIDPPALPLEGLTRAEAERELASGAGCTLSDNGHDVMIAVLGDAIVKVGGRIVHLKPAATSWNALAEGGRFSGGGIEVDVDAGAIVGREDEVVVRDASVGVTRGGAGEAVSHGPRWSCGA
jgi:hypothetical protein